MFRYLISLLGIGGQCDDPRRFCGRHTSAKAEDLYIDFGDGPTVAVSPAFNIVSGRMTGNIVRAGVNYKFY